MRYAVIAMEKRKFWIFIAIAYGVTALMTLLMALSFKQGNDLTIFATAQMMYPACGVILGKFICRKEEEKLPVGAFITTLVTTLILMAMSIASLFVHLDPVEAEGVSTDAWSMASSVVIMIGSVPAYILFWTCGKEKRAASGMARKKIGLSVLIVALFVLLSFGRVFISVSLGDYINHTNENWEQFMAVLTSPRFYLSLLVLPLNFFFSFLAFFGEEYGWRYYLQPLMQDKIGRRRGVLLLGLVWAVWHLGVDLMYYTTEYGAQAIVSQIITCVAYAVFFGYAYMKTQNIWLPVILHYFNNNFAALLGGGGSDALQNQVIEWHHLPIHVISMLVFFLFILAPVFSKKKEETVTPTVGESLSKPGWEEWK